MYKLEIITKYNTINLVIEDFNTPEIQEILEQPYIVSVKLREIKEDKKQVDDYKTQQLNNTTRQFEISSLEKRKTVKKKIKSKKK